MNHVSYAGRHRASRLSNTVRVARGGAVMATAAAATVGMFATDAGAAPSHNWSGVAQCESGGNWSINTGNGFYGGLQFTPGTWNANKPAGAPDSANQASQSQQIAAAENVLRSQGVGAWPVCGKYLSGGTTEVSNSSSQSSNQQSSNQQSSNQQRSYNSSSNSSNSSTQRSYSSSSSSNSSNSSTQRSYSSSNSSNSGSSYSYSPNYRATGEHYVVRSGDTLSKIAQAHNVAGGWEALYQLNRNIVSDPNLIYPDQNLAL